MSMILSLFHLNSLIKSRNVYMVLILHVVEVGITNDGAVQCYKYHLF